MLELLRITAGGVLFALAMWSIVSLPTLLLGPDPVPTIQAAGGAR